MYNLQTQLMVSSLIGISACCATFLGSLIHPIENKTKWFDVAFYGSLGSIIAAKYIMKKL